MMNVMARASTKTRLLAMLGDIPGEGRTLIAMNRAAEQVGLRCLDWIRSRSESHRRTTLLPTLIPLRPERSNVRFVSHRIFDSRSPFRICRTASSPVTYAHLIDVGVPGIQSAGCCSGLESSRSDRCAGSTGDAGPSAG